jgi:hypothetical protein
VPTKCLYRRGRKMRNYNKNIVQIMEILKDSKVNLENINYILPRLNFSNDKNATDFMYKLDEVIEILSDLLDFDFELTNE